MVGTLGRNIPGFPSENLPGIIRDPRRFVDKPARTTSPDSGSPRIGHSKLIAGLGLPRAGPQPCAVRFRNASGILPGSFWDAFRYIAKEINTGENLAGGRICTDVLLLLFRSGAFRESSGTHIFFDTMRLSGPGSGLFLLLLLFTIICILTTITMITIITILTIITIETTETPHERNK